MKSLRQDTSNRWFTRNRCRAATATCSGDALTLPQPSVKIQAHVTKIRWLPAPASPHDGRSHGMPRPRAGARPVDRLPHPWYTRCVGLLAEMGTTETAWSPHWVVGRIGSVSAVDKRIGSLGALSRVGRIGSSVGALGHSFLMGRAQVSVRVRTGVCVYIHGACAKAIEKWQP